MLTRLYIQAREHLLNRLLGFHPGEVLNTPAGKAPPSAPSDSLAALLKGTLNQLKAEAITPDGRGVNYQAASRSHTYQRYRSLTRELVDYDYQELASLDDQLAFWINLYNSLVIDAVIQAKVRESVTESWLGILAFFQRAAYLINGQRFSLTDIEHGVLRGNRGFPYFPGPQFADGDPRSAAVLSSADPRIHFALNCASLSCPPIGVYDPANIQSQLDLASRSFINSDSMMDVNQKTISISRIFRWYAVDFGGQQGVKDLLGQYLDPALQGYSHPEEIRDYHLIYHPYDWGLNKTNSVG